MIAFNAFKQMRAEAFDGVAADTCREHLTGVIGIKRDGSRIQCPHRKTSLGYRVENYFAITKNRGSACQPMGLTREEGELTFGRGAIRHFVEHDPITIEDLISAKHDPTRMKSGDRLRFGVSQSQRTDGG